MVQVNFRTSDFRRQVADSQALMLKNRYFEANPFLTEAEDAGPALLARPGLKRFVEVGQGPIRGLFAEAGSFNGDLFAASYDAMFRITKDRVTTQLMTGLFNPERGVVNMAITGNINDVPEYLFFADGRNLFFYTENGFAKNTLNGTPANTDVVRMGSVYYRFTNGSVNAGTPAGTLANPWLVALGVSALLSLQNLFDAVGAIGVAGTSYSTTLTKNPDVVAQSLTPTTLTIRAAVAGLIGNAIITTETGAAISWVDGGTLVEGGDPSVSVVQTPDDVGVIDVAVVNSFVIVVPAQGEGINGRFYWIEPGETTIDPLNFATAERSPDAILGVEVVGDQFWLPGESTTEVWYVSDNPDARMQRLQGVVFDRGTWENTAVAVHETLVICDADGGVFLVQGNSPQRVSTPDIEEQIREAIATQQNVLLV